MTCERAHRDREMTMEIEPGAGAGGRVGGCPQKPRGLFLRLPSRYGRSPENGGGRGGGCVGEGSTRGSTRRGDGVDVETGGNGVPGDSNGK